MTILNKDTDTLSDFRSSASLDVTLKRIYADGSADELGNAKVDLSPLTRGFRELYGWYKIVDKNGDDLGEILVKIRPDEDMHLLYPGSRANLNEFEASEIEYSVEYSDAKENTDSSYSDDTKNIATVPQNDDSGTSNLVLAQPDYGSSIEVEDVVNADLIQAEDLEQGPSVDAVLEELGTLKASVSRIMSFQDLSEDSMNGQLSESDCSRLPSSSSESELQFLDLV
jgi:hypothetical protein